MSESATNLEAIGAYGFNLEQRQHDVATYMAGVMHNHELSLRATLADPEQATEADLLAQTSVLVTELNLTAEATIIDKFHGDQVKDEASAADPTTRLGWTEYRPLTVDGGRDGETARYRRQLTPNGVMVIDGLRKTLGLPTLTQERQARQAQSQKAFADTLSMLR